MRWLRGRLGDLRLRLHGPGEIIERPTAQPLIQCLHRYPDGRSSWGPCRRIGVSPGVWRWYATCQRCGVTASC